MNAVVDRAQRDAVGAERLETRLTQVLANRGVGIPNRVACIGHHLNGGGGTWIGGHLNNAFRAAGGREAGQRGGGHAWRVARVASPTIQTEVARCGVGRAVVGSGNDDVATAACAFNRTNATAAEVKLDRRAERGRAGRRRCANQCGEIGDRHDQRLGACAGGADRCAERHPDGAAVGRDGQAFDIEAIGTVRLGGHAGRGGRGEAEEVGAESVCVAAVPCQQVCFKAGVIADKRQCCGRTRTGDVGGEQAAAIDALIAARRIAVRAEPEDAVAYAGRGFNVDFARNAA